MQNNQNRYTPANDNHDSLSHTDNMHATVNDFTNARKMDDIRLNADVESTCDADTGARLEVDVDGVRETAVARHF